LKGRNSVSWQAFQMTRKFEFEQDCLVDWGD